MVVVVEGDEDADARGVSNDDGFDNGLRVGVDVNICDFLDATFEGVFSFDGILKDGIKGVEDRDEGEVD